MAVLNLGTLAAGTIAIFVIYYIGLLVYRLYFHPLAKFPGSKLAAASLWYEFYYDVILRGQFIWKIQEMHKFYGPIIRINPDELHIDDAEYFDEIYGSATKKRDKYYPWVALSSTPSATFSTVGHEHHKLRRGPLNPFFSTKSVTELEPMVKAKVDILAKRLEQAQKTGEVIRVDAAFMALTMDVICQYAFAKDDNMLMEDDFKLAWKEMLIGAIELGALLRQFPSMLPMMNAIPDSLTGLLMPGMILMLDWKAGVRRRVIPILNRTERVADVETASHRTIFHELRDSNLPAHEKTVTRLCDDGQSLTGAGSETTAKTLTTAVFYLLQHKDLFRRLKKELRNIKLETTTWTRLTQLPYLSAVIAEALRLSYGVTTRNPRVATQEVMKYKDWEIPFGTPVSSTAYFVLLNSTIFPSPQEFQPQRWIDADGLFNHRLEKKYLVNFGRGSRNCLGMNLAYAELYLTLATIVQRFDMELFDTTIDDITMVHDFFIAVPRLDSKGIRIKVTSLD